MGEQALVHVEGLWKRYGLPFRPIVQRLSDRVRGQKVKRERYGPWALQDVSFEVKPGETLGVIGRNGAGKSTLLKVLAGVSLPTHGEVSLSGNIFPMIELNAGTNPELTGRENIYLLGTIMGMTRTQVAQRYDTIADFTELGEWLERPVWQYSSGMKARLGFGVAVNVDAEILLVDEVLAVGDISFKKKCFGHLEQLSYQGAAILFVSHSIKQVERISDRVLYLEKGRTAGYGDPEEVCYAYNAKVQDDAMAHLQDKLTEHAQWATTGEVDILNVRLMSEDETERTSFDLLETMRLRVEYDAHARLECPRIGINIVNSEMVMVTNFRSDREDRHFVLEGRGAFELTVPRLPLMPDCYNIGFNITTDNGRRVFKGDRMLSFCVEYSELTHTTYGLVHTDGLWQFE